MWNLLDRFGRPALSDPTLIQGQAPPQAVLEAQLLHAYRKARRDLRKRPYRRRARRRLQRLLALVELTGPASGPTEHGRLATMALSGRRLSRLLAEHRRLTEQIAAARSRRRARAMKGRQREKAQAINREVAVHFAQRPKQFAERLSWEIFIYRCEQPEKRRSAATATPRHHG